MARRQDKEKALIMRKQGMSYSQIKEQIKVSKSTLSNWLSQFPLSEEKIKELRDNSPIRIEKYRNTMRTKRDLKNRLAYDVIAKRIKKISDREFLIAGLFLYWAEGTKTKNCAVALTNTNPNMLIVFIEWLKFFDVPKSKLRVHLHLYSDMDIKKQTKFWSEKLGIPISQFRKPYIKKTKFSSITYSNGFGQGTCSVVLESAVVAGQVLMGIKYIQDYLLNKSKIAL